MKNCGSWIKLLSTTLFAATFLLAVPDAKADDSLTMADFGYTNKLQVVGYTGTETLENFPVLVRLSETRLPGFLYANLTNSKGADIAFFDANGNHLASEIETNTWKEVENTSLIWVKLPEMTQGTRFYMCYNTSASGAWVANENPWGDYVGVWHMDEKGGQNTKIYDATTNALDGVVKAAGNNVTRYKNGVVGATRRIAVDKNHGWGIVVDATNGTRKAVADTLGTDFSASFWMNPQGTDVTYGFLIDRRKGEYNDPGGWGTRLHEGKAATTKLQIYAGSEKPFSNNYDGTLSGNNYADLYTQNTWSKVDVHWYATSEAAGAADIYLNGEFVETVVLPQPPKQDTTANIGIGGSTQPNPTNTSPTTEQKGRRFNGFMDEVRLRPGGLSADWIKADYDTVNDPDFIIADAFAVIWDNADSGTPGLVRVASSYARFSGTVLSLGQTAGSCSVECKVWTGDAEPVEWTRLVSGLGVADDFTATVSELAPSTAYSYKLRVIGNDEPASVTPVVEGSFTTRGESSDVIGSPYTHFFDDGTNACWVANGFERYLVLEVTGYTGLETLTNFPVLVDVRKKDTNGFSYDDFYRIDGKDLAFVDELGHIIPHEIDTWNPNGMSLFWVRLPEMNNGTTFTMCYRSPLLDEVPDPGNVFEPYIGVWHMNEKENGVVDVADSTVNNLVGETHAMSLAESNGMIGYARRVAQTGGASSSAGRIIVFDHDNILRDVGPVFTYSGWYKLAKGITDPDWAYLVSRKDEDDSNGWGIQYHDKQLSSSQMRVWAADEGKNKSGFFDITGVGYKHDEWAYWTFVYSNQTFHAYFKGEELSSTSSGYTLKKPVVNDATADEQHLMIGGLRNGKGALNGYVDEARYSRGVRSADWIKAEYASMLQVNTPFVAKGERVSRGEESLVPVVIWEKGSEFPETVIDVSYAYVQFAGTVTFCGAGAETCDIEYMIWADGDVAPDEWTTLVDDARKGDKFSIPVFGLKQDMPYNFVIRAVCEVGGVRRSTREHSGSFRTNGNINEASTGEILRVANKFVHRFEAGETTFTTPDYVRNVEIFVVGGGGAGGYKVGGGGGGGGVFHSESFPVKTNTTYRVNGGRGGTAATSPNTVSTAGTGEYSAFALASDPENPLIRVPGGGGGGNYSDAGGAGADGASGGGGTFAKDGGSPVDGGTFGNPGGAGNDTTANNKYKTAAGGGGGGGREGLPATRDGWYFGGAGGVGVGSEITGELLFYGAGGGGGYMYYTDGSHYSGPGLGGDGIGGNAADVRSGTPATSGVDKTGAGGGGGSMKLGASSEEIYWKGGDGGDGVVLISYEVHGRDPVSYDPRVSMTRCAYDEDAICATIDYRAYWAGVQAYTNDLYVLYSTTGEEGVSSNAVANGEAEWKRVGTGLLGIGSIDFHPPEVGHTYWVRLVARKDANSFCLSDETASFRVPVIDLEGAIWTESAYSPSDDYATVAYKLFDTNEAVHVFCYWSEDEDSLLGDTPPSGSGVHLLDLGANTGGVLSSARSFTLPASQGLLRNRAYFIRLMAGDENGTRWFLSDDTREIDTAELPVTVLRSASWADSNVATVEFNATVGKLDPAQTELVAMYSLVEGDVKGKHPETNDTVTVVSLGLCSDLPLDAASPAASFPLWSETATNYWVRLALSTNDVVVAGSCSAAVKELHISHAVEANTLLYIVAANPKTGCYGDAVQALDYTGPEYAGLTSGWGWDNKYGLTGELACKATAQSLPGSYPITQGTLELESGGQEKLHIDGGVEYKYQYKLAFSESTYTITNAVFTASIDDITNHLYNAQAVDMSELVKHESGNRSEVSYSYRVGAGDWSDTLPEFINVGNYVVQFKATAVGHEEVLGMFNVVIKPVQLTATISACDMDYAGRNIVPEITTNVTGLVRGDLNPLTCEFRDESGEWTSEPSAHMHPGPYKLLFRVSAPNHASYTTNCTYMIRDWEYGVNLDGQSGFKMPFHVEYPGWLLRNATPDGNMAAGFEAMDSLDKRNAVLDTVCPNGLKLWQNYVINREDKSEKLVAAVLQSGGRVDENAFVVHFPDIAAVEDTGLSIRYRLDRKLRGESVFTPGALSKKYEMNVPLDAGDPSGLYVLNIVLTPTNETYAALGNSVLSSCTTIGVLRVSSILTNTVVSVPWYCTTHSLEESEDVQVANVVNPNGLVSGDSIYVYDIDTDVFNVWNWSLDGNPNKWSTNTTVTVDGIFGGTDPEKTRLPRSSAFWLVRHDPGSDGATNYVYLIGRYTGEKHVVELTPGESLSNPGHTLVGNPTLSDIDLNDLVFVDGEGNPATPDVNDRIIMMDIAGVNNTYYRNKNNTMWGHDEVMIVKGRPKRCFVQGGNVPSGTGFWYKRASGEELRIEFPAY